MSKRRTLVVSAATKRRVVSVGVSVELSQLRVVKTSSCVKATNSRG